MFLLLMLQKYLLMHLLMHLNDETNLQEELDMATKN
jgi:hypothetical protein